MSIPMIADDSIPPGTLYMLPPDVMEAMRDSTGSSERAIAAVMLYVFGAMAWPDLWWLIGEHLYQNARRKMLAAEAMVARAELIIHAAAQEKRIGMITNLGT